MGGRRTAARWERVSQRVRTGPFLDVLWVGETRGVLYLSVPRIGVTQHGGGNRPSHLLIGGEVTSRVLPPLQVGQTCPRIKLTILITRTVPLSMGKITRCLADRADEGPKHRTSHQAGGILQQMGPILGLCLSVGVTKLADVVILHTGS